MNSVSVVMELCTYCGRSKEEGSICACGGYEPGITQKSLTAYEGRATRSVLTGRYDLIPREAIDAIARRLELGASRHGENNWKGGGAEFRKATINHLFNHLLDYVQNGDTSEANTDAIICNAAFLCYFEKLIPLK